MGWLDIVAFSQSYILVAALIVVDSFRCLQILLGLLEEAGQGRIWISPAFAHTAK